MNLKIKEAARLTGLTEKTIRYYEDKGFIEPDKEEINGREFRSYSKADVDCLNQIACFRKLDFSIADITAMRDNPERIQTILMGYCSKASEDLKFKTGIIEQLEKIQYENIASIGELARRLQEKAKERQLPIDDIQLEFYKIDGISKEELHSEINMYEERMSVKFINKIRNTKVLFAFVLVLYAALAGAIWRLTYFLGYSLSFSDNMAIGWRKLLLPTFLLLFVGLVLAFVRTMKFVKTLNSESSAGKALKLCRYTLVILTVSVIIGIGICSQSLKSMEKIRADIGRKVELEWYPIYRMTYYVENSLTSEQSESLKDNALYVNQTCYNYAAQGYGDYLNTKTHDVLIYCYDPVFKELMNVDSKIEKDILKQLLKSLNGELKQIYVKIANMPEERRAALTRSDVKEAVEFRNYINSMVDNYCKQADMLLGKQRP